MKIIGLNANSHDTSVFLIDSEEKKVFGINVERITRIKHDRYNVSVVRDAYPEVFENCEVLAFGAEGISKSEKSDYRLVNSPGIYTIASLESQRILRNKFHPQNMRDLKLAAESVKSFRGLKTMGPISWLTFAFWVQVYKMTVYRGWRHLFGIYQRWRLGLNRDTKIEFFDHHLCHAAGAYYFGPFSETEETLVVTIDGYGDEVFSRAYIWQGDKHKEIANSPVERVECQDAIEFHSGIGVLYSNFTAALGLVPNCDEGKVEALAAYGNTDTNLYSELREAVTVNPETLSIEFDLELVSKFYSKSYLKEAVKQYGEKDFAAAIQHLLEEVAIDYFRLLKQRTGARQLALAGGVTANVIMNWRVYHEVGFDKIFIFPAMTDDGTAPGAACLAALERGVNIDWLRQLKMPYWGHVISRKELDEALEHYCNLGKIKYTECENWPEIAARLVNKEKVGAVVWGAGEYGPRALGNRSIIGDPRSPTIREKINKQIKRRPWYQPFCPSILEEERERLFANEYNSKHMTIAFLMRDEHAEQLPSAVHVDKTARVQFVTKEDNNEYWRLLKEVKRLSGYGVILNTSFNLHGRTMVRTAMDSLLDFLDCNLDFLMINGVLVVRAETGNILSNIDSTPMIWQENK